MHAGGVRLGHRSRGGGDGVPVVLLHCLGADGEDRRGPLIAAPADVAIRSTRSTCAATERATGPAATPWTISSATCAGSWTHWASSGAISSTRRAPWSSPGRCRSSWPESCAARKAPPARAAAGQPLRGPRGASAPAGSAGPSSGPPSRRVTAGGARRAPHCGAACNPRAGCLGSTRRAPSASKLPLDFPLPRPVPATAPLVRVTPAVRRPGGAPAWPTAPSGSPNSTSAGRSGSRAAGAPAMSRSPSSRGSWRCGTAASPTSPRSSSTRGSGARSSAGAREGEFDLT